MSFQNVHYSGLNTNRGPSPRLWHDCDPLKIAQEGNGIIFFDDFVNGLGLDATQTTQVTQGQYKAYCATAGTITKSVGFPTTATPGGFIRALADTAGDAFSLATITSPFVLNNGGGKLWFEARIGITGIATNNLHLFVGLGETTLQTLSGTVPLGDANATEGAGAMLGFNILEDGLGVLNASYADRATAWTDIQAGVGTMAAHTWKKVGFKYDPNNSAEALAFYVDGAKQSSVMTAAALAALTYLDVGGLGLLWAGYADSAGTSTYAYMDWWKCVQEIA